MLYQIMASKHTTNVPSPNSLSKFLDISAQNAYPSFYIYKCENVAKAKVTLKKNENFAQISQSVSVKSGNSQLEQTKFPVFSLYFGNRVSCAIL